MIIEVLTVTGYKPYELNVRSENDERITVIKEALKRSIESYASSGLKWVLISGQPGVEMWTFEVVQEIKDEYDLKIAVVPPFLEQDKVWKPLVQEQYHRMIESADFYQPLLNQTYEGPRQYAIKDKWLIEKSDGCLIVYEETFGGSPKYFVELANKYQEGQPYSVDFISMDTLEDIARELSEDVWDV